MPTANTSVEYETRLLTESRWVSQSSRSFLKPEAHLIFSIPLPFMARQIDHHRTRQNQNMVRAVRHIDPVGIGQRNPSFRHLSQTAPALHTLIFMLEEISLRLDIVRPRHAHKKSAAQQREQFLLHHCHQFAAARDLVRHPPRE